MPGQGGLEQLARAGQPLAQLQRGPGDQGRIVPHLVGLEAEEIGQPLGLLDAGRHLVRPARFEGLGVLAHSLGELFGQDDQLLDVLIGHPAALLPELRRTGPP